jgi:hypothetical protein
LTDRFSDGRLVRPLAERDPFARAGSAVRAGFRFAIDRVGRVLEESVGGTCGRVDNGPGYTGRSPDLRTYSAGVTMDSGRPGMPTDNASVEGFDGRLGRECPNPNWSLCLDDVRPKTVPWRREDNADHPHTAPGHRVPGRLPKPRPGRQGRDRRRNALDLWAGLGRGSLRAERRTRRGSVTTGCRSPETGSSSPSAVARKVIARAVTDRSHAVQVVSSIGADAGGRADLWLIAPA